MAAGKKYFIPLESDPALFTELIHTLGMSTRLAFHDLLTLSPSDGELLPPVPRPALALVFVIPAPEGYTERSRKRRGTCPHTTRAETRRTPCSTTRPLGMRAACTLPCMPLVMEMRGLLLVSFIFVSCCRVYGLRDRCVKDGKCFIRSLYQETSVSVSYVACSAYRAICAAVD